MILEKNVIPDRAIYWLVLYRNDDILLLRKFITKKIQIDICINQLDEIFHKECFSTLSLYTIKQVVKRHYPLLGSFYRLYLTKLLIGYKIHKESKNLLVMSNIFDKLLSICDQMFSKTRKRSGIS
ncbi:hypothetical protein NQ318_002909 [Aromia moschata]|uniref:Uncharacterized protein n=1 Tax=Aromia moschata TaxID=1265417 RepID=A0AAV8X5M7_9CUCU|nr:hypothetical protein NQ318_002909 [Aromia moschata]